MNYINRRKLIIVWAFSLILLLMPYTTIINADQFSVKSENTSLKNKHLLHPKIKIDLTVPQIAYIGFPFNVDVTVENKRQFRSVKIRAIVFLKTDENLLSHNRVIGTSEWTTIRVEENESILVNCFVGDLFSPEIKGEVGARIQFYEILSDISPNGFYPGMILQKYWPNLFFKCWKNITLTNPITPLGKVKIDDLQLFKENVTKYPKKLIPQEESIYSPDSYLVRLEKANGTWNVYEKNYAIVNVSNNVGHCLKCRITISLVEPSMTGLNLFRSEISIGNIIDNLANDSISNFKINCTIPEVTKTGYYDVAADISLLFGDDDFEIPVSQTYQREPIWIEGTEDPLLDQIVEKIEEKLPLFLLYLLVFIVAVICINMLIKTGGGYLEKFVRRKK